MRIVVYDDNKEFLDFIKDILDKINTKKENIFGSPVYFSQENEVKEYVSENKEHLMVFLLDIMDDNTTVGYELAKYIKAIEPCNIIIYVSDFSDDYLSKIDEQADSLAFVQKKNDNFCNALVKALTLAHSQVTGKVLIVEGKNFLKRVKCEDILYIEKIKETDKIILFHKNGDVHIRDTLKSIISRLEGKGVFLYSSRDFIVNAKEVLEIDKHRRTLLISNGEYIPFSRDRKKEVIECISSL